jgi:hypothetical protein
MSCLQPDLVPSISELPSNVPNPVLVSTSGPWLFVSNAPEEVLLNGGKPRSNLWSVAIPFVQAGRIRCFIWHYNSSTLPINLALRVESSVGSATITSLTYQEFVAIEDDLSVPGTCLAKAQLYGTLESPVPPVLINLTPTGGPTNLRSWQVAPKPTSGFSLVCAIVEFDYAGSGELRLWTSASVDSTFCSFATAMENAGNPSNSAAVHTRGFWPYSEAFLEVPSPLDAKLVENVNSPVGNLRRDLEVCGKVGNDVQQNEQLGPEQVLFSAQNSLDSAKARDNRGCYGVNLKYRFYVLNSESPTGSVTAFLFARNTGGKYWGAGRLILPIAAVPTGLPKFPLPVGSNAFKAQYLLNDGLPAPQMLLIGGNTPSQPIVVEMTNGGGATLPINLSLVKSVVYPTPGGGAG